MTYEQMMCALKAICHGVSVCIRKPGDWYVTMPNVERKENGCLSSGCDSGKDPEAAIRSRWIWATASEHYLVVNAYQASRRAVKWNGFMWEDVVEEKR